MTTHPETAPGDRPPARDFTMPLRETAAVVLLGATAIFLFLALLDLLVPYQLGAGPGFARRSADSFGGFVNLVTIGFPLLAVLLATHLSPELARARLITLVALIEYAVAAVFGGLFGLLVGFVVLVDDSIRAAFQGLLGRAAWLAVLGVAGLAIFQLWQGRYQVPKPKPPVAGPGSYGPPGPYAPAPGYGPPPQAGYGPPPPAGYGHPGPYGQPPAQPAAPPAHQPPPGYGPPPGGPHPMYAPPPRPASGPPADSGRSGPAESAEGRSADAGPADAGPAEPTQRIT